MAEEPSKQEIVVSTPPDIGAGLPDFIDLLPTQIKPYWEIVQANPIIEASIIVLVFFLLAFVLSRYVINLIQQLTKKTNTNLDDELIALIRLPILKTVTLIGLLIGLNSAGLKTGWLTYATPLIGSYLVLIWTGFLLNASSALIKALTQKNIDQRMQPLIVICSKIIIILASGYFLLILWGINPMGLLASAGIVGIAVGFAAKDTLANLFSGVFILADTPYKLGDYINLDSGERGKVTHIGIRSTRLLTRDDIEITIPNGIIGNAKVVNENGGPWRKMRLRLSVQCAYGADLGQVCSVLQTLAESHDGVCHHPAPRVRMRGFGDSGINFQLLCWIDNPEDRGRLTHELYMEINNQFAEHHLEIPFPKRDVYLHQSSSDDDE